MDFWDFRLQEFARRDASLQKARPMELKKGKAKKESLHIVYVMTWCGICGGSKIILEHCNQLVKRGHQVSILCHFPKPGWFPLDERVAYIQPDYSSVLGESIPKCDVIVATYWREIYECVEQNIAPVIYFEQGDNHLFESEVLGSMMSHVTKQIQIAPFVYTVSNFAATKLKEVFDVKAEVIPNAVDKTIFYPPAQEKTDQKKTVIATIGSDSTPFKCVPNILASIEELKHKGYDTTFLWISPSVAGEGRTPTWINPPQDVIGDALRSADIYVCASSYESFCLPVLEAMSCKTAVVTTDCGGVQDYVIDGENALIIEKDNINDMTEKLASLIDDAAFRDQLAENGLLAANQFDWEHTTDMLEEYYQEIAGYQVITESDSSKESVGITISLCMIVKNEEPVIARCLSQIKDVVDEIIIVDTGSTDATKSIARRFTDKVYDFSWIQDFAAARNFAFSKATMDYQMWLDADDVIEKDSLEHLKQLKVQLNPAEIDIVTMQYITHFDSQGRPMHYSTRGRLFLREKGYQWQGEVHECIPLVGRTMHFDGTQILHKKVHAEEGHKDRNLKIYEAMEEAGKPFNARSQYYYARELRDHGMIEKSAHYFELFLEGKQGWVEDNISACYTLSILYQLMGKKEKVLPVLFQSFTYESPRAEICCEIGYYYKREKDYPTALIWFQMAAKLPKPSSIGFVNVDYMGYTPNIECAVCYYEMGEYEKANTYNEAAAVFKPDSPEVISNRKLMQDRILQGKLIHTLLLLVREDSKDEDLKMAERCLRSLEKGTYHTVVVFSQGCLTTKEAADFLVPFKLNCVVIGGNENVGTVVGRQSCFSYIETHYPGASYISEIHPDMIFASNWEDPLVEFLSTHDEPVIGCGIVSDANILEREPEELDAYLMEQRKDHLERGFTLPCIHKAEILRTVGGYDARFLKGTHAFEDDSLLLGYHYYYGTRANWVPKINYNSVVYHAVGGQRFTLKESCFDNYEGLVKQYGVMGISALSKLHVNPWQVDYFSQKAKEMGLVTIQ